MVHLINTIKNKAEVKTISSKSYLIFTIGKEQCALDIAYVKEIKDAIKNITCIANSNSRIIGTISLFDTLIPVLDLRLAFNQPVTENSIFNLLVIIFYENKYASLLVDNVLDVIETKETEIVAVPEFYNIIHQGLIEALTNYEKQIVNILNIEILSKSENLALSSIQPPVKIE